MKLYLRILAYGKPYLSNGVMGLVFLVLYNVFSIFSIALVMPLLNILFETGSEQQDKAMVAAAGGSESMLDALYGFVGSMIDEHGKWIDAPETSQTELEPN